MTLQYKWPWLYKLLIRITQRKHVLAAFKESVGKNVTVLELASGFGHMQRAMDSSISYSGIDLNKRFIAYGRRHGLDLHYGDILDAKNYKESDVIVLSDVIHHIPEDNWQRLMSLAFKNARQRVVILEPAFLAIKRRNRVFGSALDWIFKELDNDGTNAIDKWYTKEEYIKIFDKGFDLPEAKDYSINHEDVYPYLLTVYSRR